MQIEQKNETGVVRERPAEFYGERSVEIGLKTNTDAPTVWIVNGFRCSRASPSVMYGDNN